MMHEIQRGWRALGLVVLLAFTLATSVSGSQEKLEVLHAWGGFREPMVDQMLHDFMSEYPELVVESRLSSVGGIHEQFMLEYAAGMIPDVVMLATKHVSSLASQGVLLDLTEFIEKDGIAWDMWVPSELQLGQWAGGTYGLPIRTGGEGGNVLYYNKQLFMETGFPSDRAPVTWDELLEYSKKLVRYDADRITQNPINNLAQNGTIQSTLNWIYSGGGKYLSDDLRSVAFNSPEAIRAMDFVRQFRTEVYRNPDDDKMSNEDFYNGRSAMFLWGSEGFSYVWDQDPDFPLGAGPRPKHPDSEYIGANVSTWHYVIPVTAKNPEDAWELLKWLTIREESAGWFVRAQGRASPVGAFNRHPDYLVENPLTPVLGQVLDQVAPVPVLPIQDDIAIPLRDGFRKVIAGETTAAAALADVASRAQVVLDAYWEETDLQ